MHGIVLTILTRELCFQSSLFDNYIIRCNQVTLSVQYAYILTFMLNSDSAFKLVHF